MEYVLVENTTGNTSAEVSTDLRPEIYTLALIAETVPDGTDAAGEPKTKIEFSVLSKSKDIEDARSKGTILIEQTFGYQKPVTLAGINKAISDEDALLDLVQESIKRKATYEATKLLRSLDADGNPEFQPIEGTFDMQDLLNKASNRRSTSPLDKVNKMILNSGIAPDQLAQLLQAILAQKANS
jgi:hypothetical protein